MSRMNGIRASTRDGKYRARERDLRTAATL
jgi:hypothetical protein